jgi:RHS repeat-associated protein
MPTSSRRPSSYPVAYKLSSNPCGIDPFRRILGQALGLAITILLLTALRGPHAVAATVATKAGASGCGITMSCPPPASPPAAPTTPTGPAACGPAAGGAPCGASSGVASQTGQGGVDVGAGNPINVINGNKYQREDDLPALPGVLGLEIVRHYNSAYSTADTATGILGRGWKLSYETDLYAIGNTVQIMQADGRRVMFSRDPDNPSRCSTTNPADGQLRIDRTAQGDTFTWTWTSGRVLNFDSHGKLVQIVAPTGEFVSLQRDLAGMLVQVTDPQGRQLHLHYPTRSQAGTTGFRGVSRIDSPVGAFGYHYGGTLAPGATVAASRIASNLVMVDFPDGASRRQYHHEDARRPTYLTGISVIAADAATAGKTTATRIGTYLYDTQGRAILTVRGWPARLQTGADGKPLHPARLVDGTGIGQVTLDFSAPGKTVIANSLGQPTTYRHAIIGGEYRVLDVIGAGCSRCGAANVRYGWLPDGQLASITTLTDDGTTPVATQFFTYDPAGRQIATYRQAYTVAGRPSGQRRLVQRQEFGPDHDRPLLIARPSVVPGAEYKTRIDYGTTATTSRLPVRITETGYVPALDGQTAAQTITRSIDYRLDARGARVAIDGPLPNAAGTATAGPENSDITIRQYDPATHLVTKIVAPGGESTEILSRDAALRPILIRTGDGVASQTTAITRNWRGQPLDIRIDAEAVTGRPVPDGDPFARVADGKLSRTLHYRYDALGRLIALTQADGTTTQMVYDAAGRLTRRILANGSSLHVQQDTEDRQTEADLFADGQSEAVAAALHESRHYDRFGHLDASDDATGPLQRQRFDARGRPIAVTDGAGIATRLDYDDNDALLSSSAAAGTPDDAVTRLQRDALGNAVAITDPNGVTTRQWHDDFGRKVAERSPDRGITLYRFDAAGHEIARIDETGAVTRSTYDHAGRVISLGLDGEPALTRFRYLGMRLQDVTSMADGKSDRISQQTRYQYDAFGQVIRERAWIARVDAPAPSPQSANVQGPGLHFDTVNRYDPSGRMIEQILPDGHRLGYTYATPPAAGTSTGAGKPGQLLAIRFDDQVVVSDIRQGTTGALTGYVSGNGIRQQITIDGRGRIAQLTASLAAAPEATASSGKFWTSGADWFADLRTVRNPTLYRQDNRFDAAGRLAEIRRQNADPATGQLLTARVERYTHDRLDRLTGVELADGAATALRYDRGGNRTEEITATGTRRYRYAAGTNRLIALTTEAQPPSAAGAPPSMQKTGLTPHPESLDVALEAAWFFHPTGVPLAQLVFGRGSAQRTAAFPDGGNRRIAYNSARRPVAIFDKHNRALVRYHYNSLGERIAKTVYPQPDTLKKVNTTSASDQPGITSYSLFRNQRLAAETDAAGRITAHYIYLNGKPVAKIEMTPNTALPHKLMHTLKTLGGYLGAPDTDATDTVASIYAIHTDHLGTPQTVTDADQHIVWQARTSAFGEATIIHARHADDDRTPFTMDLRLPGQVFDAETGLHYNYQRDYDPRLGRYLTPDPLGLGGGVNPYDYVRGNPLTGVDPLGLYEEDVHYYMTYFLALTAGLPPKQAWVIAMGDRYIDDNPYTEPYGTAGTNLSARSDYHFTQAGYDPIPKFSEFSTTTDSAGDLSIVYSSAYMARRVINPVNAQLTRLSGYALNAPTTCSKSQLYGEYLHAFEDTFAHRDAENAPYEATLGHLAGGHNPDHTYNVEGWIFNESRTLEMEQEVFAKFKSDFNKNAADFLSGKPIAFVDLKTTLINFNQDTTPESPNLFESSKIQILQTKLFELGLPRMEKYAKTTAKKCRVANLRDANGNALKQDAYPGAILTTSNATTNQSQRCE